MMTNTLAVIAHYVFGWSILTLALSWMCAATYPLIKRHMRARSALLRGFYTLLFALLAPVIAGITLVILSFPNLAHSLIAPHCHGDLCTPHTLDLVVETLVSSAVLAAAGAGVLWVLFLMASQLMVFRQRVHTLEKLSEQHASGYLRFESPKPIAWCFGLLRPKVFISSGLLATASPAQRRVILAYEGARAARYDNLRTWLLHWATLLWPRRQRRQIRLDFRQYCDTICDIKAFAEVKQYMGIAAFVDTLKHCYDSPTAALRSAALPWQQRLSTLQREWDTQWQQRGKSPSLIVGCTTLVAALLVISVYIGHPLLEVLT